MIIIIILNSKYSNEKPITSKVRSLAKYMSFLLDTTLLVLVFFLVNYVEERPWRPTQSPNNGRKKKAKRLRGREDQISFIDLRVN